MCQNDGNDIVDVTQANVAPTAGLFSIGLDVETANKKFGIIQFIEQRNIVGMFNQPCTLSFSARTSGTSIGNLKAVILSWNGTADTVTSDVVSAWGADGVTPTWAANWTAENTPTNLAPSNTWTRYSITATVDTASTNNVAVFIWCDDMTTTLGDFLYVTDVQLEVGIMATPFERQSMQATLAECQRYFENSGFPSYSVPTGTTGQGAWIPAASAYTLCAEPQFRTTKRAIPTVTIYNTNNLITGSTSEYLAGGAFVTNRSSVADYASNTKFRVSSAGQFATGRDYNFSWIAEIEL